MSVCDESLGQLARIDISMATDDIVLQLLNENCRINCNELHEAVVPECECTYMPKV